MLPLFSEESPFFSCHGFSLFECSALPWLQRTFSILQFYREVTLMTDKFKRLYDWYEACLQVPAFKSTIVDTDALIANYIGYSNNTANNNCSGLSKT